MFDEKKFRVRFAQRQKSNRPKRAVPHRAA
jgi:hypothetical protein